MKKVEEIYRLIQRKHIGDLKTPEVFRLLTQLFEASQDFLQDLPQVNLRSLIPGKSYFGFESKNGKVSRAVNRELYQPSFDDWKALGRSLAEHSLGDLDPIALNRAIYCAAISFCAVIDLSKTGDQKTPGTFFEYLIGHLFASRLGINPRTRLPVLNLDMETTLPTDFVFDLGPQKAKFHLPIKTSTRERVIQVWAHQRVLDGVYGTGRFLGTPVILAETKTDRIKREVIEICLPDQWRIYQMHIAQLKRIYYLDVPMAYAHLNAVFPPLNVKPFGQFFVEADALSAAAF